MLLVDGIWPPSSSSSSSKDVRGIVFSSLLTNFFNWSNQTLVMGMEAVGQKLFLMRNLENLPLASRECQPLHYPRTNHTQGDPGTPEIITCSSWAWTTMFELQECLKTLHVFFFFFCLGNWWSWEFSLMLFPTCLIFTMELWWSSVEKHWKKKLSKETCPCEQWKQTAGTQEQELGGNLGCCPRRGREQSSSTEVLWMCYV